jgi:hypothetical protein
VAPCYTAALLSLSLTQRMRALAPRYRKAQRESQALYRVWNEAGTDERLLHPMWKEARQVFAELITAGLPPNFLTIPFVRHMLYRTGFGERRRLPTSKRLLLGSAISVGATASHGLENQYSTARPQVVQSAP